MQHDEHRWPSKRRSVASLQRAKCGDETSPLSLVLLHPPLRGPSLRLASLRNDTQLVHPEPDGVRCINATQSMGRKRKISHMASLVSDVIIEKHWRGLLPRTIVDHFWAYGAPSLARRHAELINFILQ